MCKVEVKRGRLIKKKSVPLKRNHILCTGKRRKMPERHLRNKQELTESALTKKYVSISFEKTVPETRAQEGLLRALGFVSLCSSIQALRGHCSHHPRRPGYCFHEQHNFVYNT